MNKRIQKDIVVASLFLAIFVIFTILLRFIDVDNLAPDGSLVGFSTLNALGKKAFPFHSFFYILTEVLGNIALASALAFAILGAYQWFVRKKLSLVDRDILCLGVLFAVVLAIYAFFEVISVNVRPVLINGTTENSYPSSHTVLSIVVFFASVPLLMKRTGNMLSSVMVGALPFLSVLTVVGRLLSGVHWVTDLIGGVLLALALLFFYFAFLRYFE